MTDRDDRPNILLLFADQQRHDTIGAAGFPWMRTPNLDRLAETGCVFPNAYSPNPICVPARHCLLTGTTGRHHGFWNNGGPYIADDGLPTLPRVLSDAGYYTAAVGKMHFRPARRHHGYLDMHLMEEIPAHFVDDAYCRYLHANGYGELRCIHGVRPYVYHLPQESLVPFEHHGTSFVATRTIEVLEAARGRPFFLMAGWIKPHPPWNVPADWQDAYAGADLPEPIPISREAPYYAGESAWYGDADSPEHRRAIREAYYSCVSMIDFNVGRILDYLESTGQLDNTLVIYTSDHGEMLQDKGFYQKAVPFESASRVPFLVRWPRRVEAGSRDERFVDLMDVLPTALDAAGIDLADKPCREGYELAGGSVLPGGDSGRDRSEQFVSFGIGRSRWIMLRDERTKYVHFYNGGIEHLYDLQADPQELSNLLAGEGAPHGEADRVRREFRRRCIEHEARWGPPEQVADGDFASFDYEPPAPERGPNKYPDWANRQFPKFAGSGQAEAARVAGETAGAMARHGDPNVIRDAAPDAAWIEDWWQQFHEYGATEAMRDDLLP